MENRWMGNWERLFYSCVMMTGEVLPSQPWFFVVVF